MNDKTAIQKAVDTINSIKKELDDMPTYTARQLNEVEGRIRIELQVMEALVNHLGREVFQHVQSRRRQLRGENRQWIDNVVNPAEARLQELLGDNNGNSGTSGDTRGGNKSRRPKQKGNPKA